MNELVFRGLSRMVRVVRFGRLGAAALALALCAATLAGCAGGGDSVSARSGSAASGIATEATTAAWDTAAVERCRRSSSVGPAAGGGLTLIDRDLIEYETGATVHAADRSGASELVTDSTWIRKEFVLDRAACSAATLCINHAGDAAGLEVFFNDKPLPFEVIHDRARAYSGVYPKDKFPEGHPMHHLNGKPFKSHFRGGWQEVTVDPKLLRRGTNTVVIRAKKGRSCRFWIEQSLYPDRSAVSRDGGKTWDSDHLSSNGNLNGEYVIRLLLRRHPAKGWIESEPVDLWPKLAGTDVRVPAAIVAIDATMRGPEARVLEAGARSVAAAQAFHVTRIDLLLRVGPTPTYDPATWTAWAPADELADGEVHGKPLAAAAGRYAQWRVELTPSAFRSNADVLKGLTLTATVRPRPLPPGTAIAACEIEQPEIVRPSHPFVHAKKTKRLDLLREQAKLDELFGKHPRGVEQLRRVAQWIRSLKLGNNDGGKLDYKPTWDGLQFWNFARPGEIGRMCTTRGAFFVQCATALGYPARPMIWSHAIAEVWVDDLGKWVAFDPSGGHYYEVDGVPASILEVGGAWRNPKLQVRRAWDAKSKSGVLDDLKLVWYTRFFVPMRSNFLESDEPREPAHGKYSFKYDGHLRWLHPKREPLPWFAFATSREGDLAFTCNTVNLHLARTSEPDSLAVQIATDMPNVARFEARREGGDWAPVTAAFVWTLVRGENEIEVRGVNTFGVPGRVAKATVRAGR